MSTPHAPEPRIGDADREAAVSTLGEHFAAGRLTKEEFDERSDLAWAAKTASGLWPLFADLPRPRTPGASAAPVGVAPAATRSPVQGRPGPPFGTALKTVLIVIAVLVGLAHLPLVLLGLMIWFFATRSGGHSC